MKKDVEATISYWRDPGDGSLPDADHDAEIVLGHWDEENRTVLVRDIRGAESSYFLDTHGFEAHTLSKKERDATNQVVDESEYFEEISNMIKTITGAKQVIVFGKVIRQLGRGALKPQEFKGAKVQAPSPRPHVDFAADNAETQACRMVPGGAELVKNASRWQILGVWGPTKSVRRDPLVLADSRSVPDSDFRDLSRDKTWGPDAKYVVSMLKHGDEKQHHWHYWSDMMPGEVLVFKHFDSKKDISAWRCAHTSIELPGTETLPPRESVEVRALVGY